MSSYPDVLAQLRRELPEPFPEGSKAEAAAIARFRQFFSDFSPNKVDQLLDQTYAEDIWFNDTLKTVEGRAALKHYLKDSASAVDACRVEIHEVIRSPQADYWFRWSMMIRFKRFKRGVDTHSIGMSHLRFDREGRVRLHQDYWDSTSGLFQHVPVLAALIGLIKRRL